MKGPSEPKPPERSRAVSLRAFAAISAAVVVVDLFTKWLAFDRLADDQIVPVIPALLNFRLSRNLGAVFGLGQGMRVVFIFLTLAALGGILWAAWRHGAASRLLSAGLALLFGGAVGNLYDRLVCAHVRDFIDLYARFGGRTHHWPTFNVADMAICAGAGAIILDAILHPHPARPKPGAA